MPAFTSGRRSRKAIVWGAGSGASRSSTRFGRCRAATRNDDHEGSSGAGRGPAKGRLAVAVDIVKAHAKRTGDVCADSDRKRATVGDRGEPERPMAPIVTGLRSRD